MLSQHFGRLTSFSRLNHSNLNLDQKKKKKKKILKRFLKVTFILCSSCQITKSHPRNSSTHTCVPIQPFEPSLVSPFPNGELQFQEEKQIDCIYSLVLSFSRDTQIHGARSLHCHLFTAWHCFPILLEWWIILAAELTLLSEALSSLCATEHLMRVRSLGVVL